MTEFSKEHLLWIKQSVRTRIGFDDLVTPKKWSVPKRASLSFFPLRTSEALERIDVPLPTPSGRKFHQAFHFRGLAEVDPQERVDFGRVIDFIEECKWWNEDEVLDRFVRKLGPLGRNTWLFRRPNLTKEDFPEAGESTVQYRLNVRNLERNCPLGGPIELRMDWKDELKALRTALFLRQLSRDQNECRNRVYLDKKRKAFRVRAEGSEGYHEECAYSLVSPEELLERLGESDPVQIVKLAPELEHLTPVEAREVVRAVLENSIDAYLSGQFRVDWFADGRALPMTLAGGLWIAMKQFTTRALVVKKCDGCGRRFSYVSRQGNPRKTPYCHRWLSPRCYRRAYEQDRNERVIAKETKK